MRARAADALRRAGAEADLLLGGGGGGGESGGGGDGGAPPSEAALANATASASAASAPLGRRLVALGVGWLMHLVAGVVYSIGVWKARPPGIY